MAPLTGRIAAGRELLMPFMGPVIEQGDWFEVDGTAGITCIPADLVSLPPMADGETLEDETTLASLSDYCEGTPQSVTYRRGWYGVSAPGYLDCTDWTVFETEGEAAEYIAEQYDVCPFCGEDLPQDDEQRGEDGVCQCGDEDLLSSLQQRGFDRSHRDFADGGCTIGCSRCQAASINGVPCHERGCPNTPADCPECGQTYPNSEDAARCCAFDNDEEDSNA